MDSRGLIIRQARNKLDLKLIPAAERCGVTAGTISRLESGKMPRASMDTLAKIAQGLNIDLNDLAANERVESPVAQMVGAAAS